VDLTRGVNVPKELKPPVTKKGFIIKIPSLNIEERVPFTNDIQDVIKKILSDATEQVREANLQLKNVGSNVPQDQSQDKKKTPISP
jgi:hypothetical protein